MSNWTVKAHNLRATQAQQLTTILNEIDPHELQTNARFIATAGGDERKLRGIPAIGRNVAGAIPGTSPHAIRSKP